MKMIHDGVSFISVLLYIFTSFFMGFVRVAECPLRPHIVEYWNIEYSFPRFLLEYWNGTEYIMMNELKHRVTLIS